MTASSDIMHALDAAKLAVAGFHSIAEATSSKRDDGIASKAEDVFAVVLAIVHAVSEGLAGTVKPADVVAAKKAAVDALAANDAATLAKLKAKFGR